MRKTSTTLAGIVLALLSLGLVMLGSTSSVRASARYDDPLHFLKQQLLWLLVALVIGYVLVRFDYHHWQRLAVPIVVVALILLALVLIPGIGAKVGGARRWLRLGPARFQPSELAKLAVIVGLAAWSTSIGRRIRCIREGVVMPIAGLGVMLGLLFLEPDFGTTVLIGAVGMAVLYVAGSRIEGLIISAAVGVAGLAIAIANDPHRLERILAIFRPGEHQGASYQLGQSILSFVRGGLIGVGLGNSVQKQFYLPEAHTDFILAIIGEELGFGATCLVVALFICLVVCGLMISLSAPDRFGSLLAFGITVLIGLQAAINVGVVSGLLPTKGLPLPFMSYGGSSLVMSVACVAVLLNVASHCGNEDEDEHTRRIRNREHHFE